MGKGIWVVIGGGLLLLLLMVGSYNGLVQSDETVNQAWADVESSYQRRMDLIPNLVETVKGAADFEQSTLEAVTQARASVGKVQLTAAPSETELAQFQAAQDQLGGALSRLLVTAEAYPQLMATQSFRDLQAQLEGTENRINVARRDYNDAVRDYNTRRRSFPTVLLAGIMGFEGRAGFQAAEGAENAPKVDFGGQP